MKDVTASNFGLLIAYLAPGFTTLWGLSHFSPTLRSWLGSAASTQPTVGGFLYVTVASVAVGLTVSAVRWAMIDTLHHSTGVAQPDWDFAKLRESVVGFNVLNELYYRYYQFYANMLVAVLLLYFGRRAASGWASPVDWEDAGFAVIELILFAGSRDTLVKYYRRTEQLLRPTPRPSSLLAWFGKPLFQLFEKRRQRRTQRMQNRP